MSKTRMGKRVASLLLSLVMMLSLLPTTVYAEGADTGATYGAVQQTEPGDNTENTGKLESTGEGEDDSEAGNEGETSVTYVAQVGDVQYKTLEEAIGVAADGATVSLLDNVTLNTTLTVEGKTITIDVGGFTLTVATDGDGIVVNNATLTLTGTGKYVFNCTASGSDGIFVNNTVEGGTSELNLNGNVDINVSGNVSSAIHAYASAGKAVVNINAGTITARGSKQFPGVVVDQNATLNMTGGTFDLSMDFDAYSDGNDVVGVLIWGGSSHKQENCAVNISGGTFKVGGKNAFAQAVQVGMSNGYSENCTVNISGGNVVLNPTEGGKGYVYTAYKASYATAAITGGTVSGKVTAIANTYIRDLENDGLTISGGTFSGITVDEKYLAEGKTLNESGNVVDKAPEVKRVTVNGVGYDTLEEAIAAAQDDDTVTLLADVGENVEIAAGKNLTLDLNGCTLNGGTGTNKAALTNYGTITITDSSEAKTGTIKRNDIGTVGETSYYVILNQGTMTIESGTVINNSGYKKANSTGSMVGSSLICNGDCNGGSTLTINGGTFTQYNFIAIKNGALGVLNVTGGMITSNHSAIQNWFEANITGGEIKGQLWTDAYTAGVSDGKTKIGGNATFTGEIVMDIYGNSVAPTLEIAGGKLDVTNWKITDAAANVGAKPAISGGTFKAAVPADYLADGFEIKESTDASGNTTYGVEKAASYVAMIGEKGYDTLEEAINATATGDTVTLLADVDLGGSSVSFYNKKDTSVCDLTFDLNGHTITSAIGDNGTVLAAREGLVIKNGAIVNTSESTNKKTSAICVTSKGTTTIENVTVTSKVSGVYICQLTSTGAEVVNVESGTFISGEYGVYIANPKGSTTKSPVETLNINGGTINGTHTGVYAKGAESGSRNAVVNVNITAGTVSSVGVYGAKEEQPVNLTVSGGTISDKLHIDNLGGKALVTGGAVKGAVTNNGTLTISGGTFNGDLTNKTNGSITISGGTFTTKPNETYLADGYVFAANADGTFSVKAGAYVAEVNGTGYETLAAAIKAAESGDTVTLLANVNLTSAQAISKQLTLDLNGKTISSTAYRTIQLNAGADLTVKDSASGGKITNTYTGKAYPATIYLNAAGTKFTLEGGTIESDPNVTSLQSVAINSEKGKACEVNIKGGSVIVPEAATEGRGIVASTNSMTLKISGGTITGGLHGVDAYSGSTVNITGGEITAHYVDTGVIKEAYGMRLTGTANVTVAGGTITGVKMNDNGNDLPKVTLASGRVNGSFYSIVTSYKPQPEFTVAENATIVLGNDSAAKFLPDTVKLVQNSDGTYGVKAGAYVAQIGETTYETLEAAFAHAKDGDTITLLTDCSGNGIVVEKEKFTDKGLIVDFNNHTYTVGGVLVGSSGTKSNGFQLNKDNKITFRNGAIYGDASVAGDDTTNWTGAPAILIQNYCDLTLSGMKVSGGSNTVYTMSNNCGNVVIENTTINAGGGGSGRAPFALDACGYGSYTGVSVTVKGTSAINGDIEVSRSASNENAVKLALEGGTVTGELKIDSSIKSGDATTVTKGADVTLDAPTGYMWNDANTLVKAVAEVNGTQYETLQAAIDKAGRNATVKLLADTRENVIIDKALTLDLNGFTLNGSTGERKPALTITARTVTIKDSSTAQTGMIMREDTAENSGDSSHYVIDIQGNAWVMFESGTVKNDSGAGGTKGASLVRVGNDSVARQPGLVICGGTFTQDNFIVIKVDRGYLKLKGGTLNSANSYAVENWYNANINGGTVNGDVAAWTYSGGTNSFLTIEDGTINGNVTSVNYGNAENRTAKVSITGGTVNGELGTYIYSGGLTETEDTSKATIGITGGTFKENPTKYVVESSAVKSNDDGTFGVEKAYLAKVGDTSYYTMKEAFEAQTASGEPIVMLRDYTTGSPFRSGSINRTVDLNGHTWTCTGTDANSAAFEINNSNVTLTVKNGKVVSSQLVGLIPSAMSGTIKYDNSGLVFESVEMKTTAHSGIETNGNNTNDTVTLKNSTLDVPNGFGIYFPSSGTLTIDNSTITAKTMGVQVCSGSLNINAGSEITVTDGPVDKTENDGAIQDGAAISIVNRTGYKGLDKIEVTGGKFTAKAGNDAIKAYNWENNTATDFTANDKVFVSGGTFSSIPDNMTELCAKDYIPELTPSGAYEVRKADYVAAISDKQYTSLANAIAAAKDGDTVKLLDDVVLDKTLIIKDKTITLDLNGKTISNSVDIWNENTYAWSLISVRDKGNLTIDDTTGGGTLKAKENDCFALDVYAYDTKNVENTKLTINAGNYVGNISAVYAFTGKATINGGHFSIQQKESGSDPYRLTLNCYDSSYTAGTAHITVTGGTFKGFDPANNTAEGEGTSFVPDGYIPKANGDGSYTVVKGTYVAEYDGTKYETLQKAIDAASQKNGGQAVVTLLGDLTITETVNFANVKASSVLLDLGGHTLTGEGCRALQINKGNLYLENGTVTSTGIINSSSVIRIGSNEDAYSGVSPLLYMRKGAKVLAPVSYGVTIFGSATVSETLTVAGNASIEATGPSPAISGQGGQAYHVDGKGTKVIITGNAVVSATNNYAIYHPDNGTLKIQNSATVSGKGGIQMCSGTLNISGSPKIEALGKANHETGASGPIYDIAAISVVNRGYPGGAPVVTIKGTPTITANEGEVIHAYTWSSNAESVWAEAGDNINVSGGTYSKTFNEAYLAADCTLVANDNGTYTVKQAPVAEYNGNQYTSLSQALLDARNAGGGEVKLLKDVTQTTYSLDIGKVTLNLNTKTLTLDGGAQLYTSGDATINNGTIKRIDTPTSGSANSFAIQVMSGSSLVLGTTSDDTVAIESTYGVYNVGGTLTVSHAVITTDGWSVAVSDSKTKTGEVTIGEGAVITSQNGNCIGTMVNSKPNVTITGGRLTSDGTAWDAGVIYWASEGTLTITGGTFTASSAEGSTAAAVHQKNGTVKISGTTAELQGNKALVVQAGDGSTGTMVTELSGGTYSTKPEEAWVVNGYRAIENTDGSYTVKAAKYVIKVTSCIEGTDQTVATPTGGGMYCEGEKVTVATNAVAGFKFLGWYDGATLLDTHMTYEHTVTGDCTLIAKYTAVSGGTFRLEVNASKFTVDEKTKMRYVDMRINAATEVVVEYTGNDKFLYWINGSNNVVSTEAKITLVAVGNFKLTAVVESTELGSDYAYVIFKNAFVKGQSLSADYYTSSDTIVFPSTPVYVGRTFKYWGTEVNGEIVEATQAVISDLIKNGATTVIIAPVYESNGTYTVKVNYVDTKGNSLKDTLTISGIGTGLMQYVTADEKIDELTFSHWEIGGKNVGTNKTYAALSRTNGDVVALTAVYVTEGTVTKPENVLTIAATGANIEGGKYKLTFTANYSIDENATIKKGGILFSNKDIAEDIFTINNTSLMCTEWDGDIAQSGARNGVINYSKETTRIYARAYITLADGTVIYSDIVNATYSEIVKK